MKMNKLTLMLVIATVIIVPFTNDIYVPAMPEMAKLFQTSHIQLLLSTGLIGFAISQLIYGPLSDRFGRKPVLVSGLVLFTIASAAILFSPNFQFMLVMRFFQAVGACSAVVSILAIARDVYPQERIVHATSLIFLIIGVCPAVAPLLGSGLTLLGGWRANFAFLLILGVLFLLVVSCLFEETQAERNFTALNLKPMLKNYKGIFTHRAYVSACITSAFSYGVLFSYIGVSPLFVIKDFGFHLISYGLVIAVNAVALFAMGLCAPKLAGKFGLRSISIIGSVIILIGGVMMLIANHVMQSNIYTFMLPMFIATIGIGLIRPTASAIAMSVIDHRIAGSAAAGFNFILFIGGAAATVIGSIWIHSVAEFALLTTLLAVGAIAGMLLSRKAIAL